MKLKLLRNKYIDNKLYDMYNFFNLNKLNFCFK